MNTTPGLAQHLREATAAAHTDAERSAFVRLFMKGQLDRATYQRYLRALQTIYGALEAALAANADHPAVRALNFTELPRSTAIETDLQFFETPADTQAPPVADEYATHLKQLGNDSPVLLVAHSYVRYLGDLSGGQALARAVQKTFALADDGGVAFYRFPEISDLNDFKNVYRAALDHLPVSAEEHQAIVEEAKAAFAWNGRVFAALDPQD